jgi:hypothetical protein
VIPLPGRAHPLATPGLADGQGFSGAENPPEGEEAMTYPTFIEIDGKRVLWREIVQRRREQLKAAAKAVQPALFELKDDTRPVCERTAARRYLEPSLFTLLDAEG